MFTYLSLLLIGFLPNAVSGQAAQGFEGITTTLNCGSLVTCHYFDVGDSSVQHFLADYTGGGQNIPVNQTGAAGVLGFVSEFTPSRTVLGVPSIGLKDGDAFGVATDAEILGQFGAGNAPPEGTQAFLMEDTDGWVTVYFDYVDLTAAVTPAMSMKYFVEANSYENSEGANDRLYARVVIDNCASATTITLIDTDGGGSGGGGGLDMDDGANAIVEGAWTMLSANLTPYIGCRAQLIIEVDLNSSSEEVAIDDIQFTAGTRQPFTPGTTPVPCTGPTITTQPQDVTITPTSDPFFLSVAASGTASTNLSYQWEIKLPTASGFSAIVPGVTSSLGPLLPSIPNGTQYRVIVTDNNGTPNVTDDDCEVISNVVTITSVDFTGPADLCVDAGLQANLSGGSPAGGTYGGLGVTDNADGTYDFDPAVAGVGERIISYSFMGGVALDTVEVFPVDTTNVFATTCDSGQVGVAQVTLTNQFGCDSVVITTTSLLPSDTTIVAANTCDPAQVGVMDTTFTNQFGCDSVVITTTILLPSDTTIVAANTCDPAQVGVDQVTLTNQFGCDSVIITTTTLLPSDTTSIALTTCDSTQVGVVTQTFTNQFGCDSLVITTTTLLNDTTSPVIMLPADTTVSCVVGATNNQVLEGTIYAVHNAAAGQGGANPAIPQLGTLDPLSGVFTVIGVMTDSATGSPINVPGSIAISPDGFLYAVTNSFGGFNPPTVYRVNPITAIAANLGSYTTTNPSGIKGIAFDDTGRLLGLEWEGNGRDIYEFDLSTGSATKIFEDTLAAAWYGAAEKSPFSNLIYTGSWTTGDIQAFNPVSGASVDVTTSGVIPATYTGDIVFGADSNLYVTTGRRDGTGPGVYRVDIPNDTAVKVASFNFPNGRGIVAAASILEISGGTASANTGVATATDNCTTNPVISFSDSTVAGNCDGNFTIYRTWTATDAKGNSSSGLQIISVIDTLPPVFTSIPADLTFCEGETVSFDTPDALDSCNDNVTVSCTRSDTMALTADYPIGVTTITCVATDPCGNSSSTQFTITVNPKSETNLMATTCHLSEVGIDTVTLTNQFGCDSLVITNTTLLPLCVKEFILVDADADTNVVTLTEGACLLLQDLPENFNIIAIVEGTETTDRVTLDLNGPVENERTERKDPYAVFGDIKGDYSGRPTTAGMYDITATPYYMDGGLVMGTSLTVNFKIVDCEISGPVANAGPHLELDCTTGNVMLMGSVSGGNGSVMISWTGPNGYSSTDLMPTVTEAGVYTLTATDSLGCTTSDEVLVELCPVDCTPEVYQFVLVNSDTDQDIMILSDGAMIDLVQVGWDLNIRADVLCGNKTESVRLELSGAQSRTRTENKAPYALAGDSNGDYSDQNFVPGSYSLTATPYPMNNAQGAMGIALTINFTVITGTPAPQTGFGDPSLNPDFELSVFPVPANDELFIDMKFFEEGTYQADMFDVAGRAVMSQRLVYDDVNGKRYSVDTQNLSVGVYMIRITGQNYQEWKKVSINR